jgi:hypothetical protein
MGGSIVCHSCICLAVMLGLQLKGWLMDCELGLPVRRGHGLKLLDVKHDSILLRDCPVVFW